MFYDAIEFWVGLLHQLVRISFEQRVSVSPFKCRIKYDGLQIFWPDLFRARTSARNIKRFYYHNRKWGRDLGIVYFLFLLPEQIIGNDASALTT